MTKIHTGKYRLPFMIEWTKYLLGDLGKIVGGSTPSTSNNIYFGGNISWITPKDLSNHKGRYISHGERNLTDDGFKNCSAKIIPKNSILFTSRAPIGYIAIAENKLCTNQGFKSIIPNDKIDHLFLYYLLLNNRKEIENMGSGTTFKEISGTVMKQIEVNIPTNKTEQIKISHVLDGLDSRIEVNNAINHN
ncbi:MAG: restriction endonuclease subunit S, partial [Rickettsiales bacterium]|nr:restriction endonuclease subunit S [Rickettsiales bacterium]